MELQKLYNLAEKENIGICNFKMSNKAIIGEVDSTYCIGMNYSKIEDSKEEKSILAEELGHYYCNSLYDINSDKTTISKKEYRAKKWAFKTLISPEAIKNVFQSRNMLKWEIADELGISEELLDMAIEYYKNNNLIGVTNG